MGVAGADGGGQQPYRRAASRDRVPAALAAGRWPMGRSELHCPRLPARLLSEVPRLLRLLSTVGSGELPSLPTAPRAVASPSPSGSGSHFTGVIAALPAEARCLREGQPAVHAGRSELQVRISGIGGERAARAAEQLLEAGAEALLSFGVGGALDPALRCGDIVVASAVLSQSAGIPTEPEWRRTLAARLATLGRVRVGTVLSSDDLVSSVEHKQQLFNRSGAIAVDMESAAVARIAEHHHVPFMALRVIADTAQDSLPRVLHGALGSGAAVPHGASFYWSLLSAPGSWRGLARLGRRYLRARSVLARCAGVGVAWSLH